MTEYKSVSLHHMGDNFDKLRFLTKHSTRHMLRYICITYKYKFARACKILQQGWWGSVSDRILLRHQRSGLHDMMQHVDSRRLFCKNHYSISLLTFSISNVNFAKYRDNIWILFQQCSQTTFTIALTTHDDIKISKSTINIIIYIWFVIHSWWCF